MEFSGEVTIEQVLLTFIERSVNYGKKNNWLAEVCFDEALALARHQDKQLKENKQIIFQKGQELFGIPVTFKDQFLVKGYDATVGLATKCFQPCNYDGYQAHAVKGAGGIVFAKTNNPQLCLSYETNNFIFGRAKNPYNPKYTSGGSSGVLMVQFNIKGEASMISAKCSIVGMATDLGGSIRIPASFNGIYALKPCSRRIFNKGSSQMHPTKCGQKNLMSTNGPMGSVFYAIIQLARNVDDLVVMMKVLLDDQTYLQAPLITKDIHFQPIPFNDAQYTQNKKMKIGYFKSINFLPSCQANQRAVQIAVESLIKYGHSVVEVSLDEILTKAFQITYHFTFSDDLKSFKVEFSQMLDGEKSIPEYQNIGNAANIPKFIFKIQRYLLSLQRLNRQLVIANSLCQNNTAYNYLLNSCMQGEIQKEMAQYWDVNQLDAILSPVTAGVALKHHQGMKSNYSMQLIKNQKFFFTSFRIYCSSWNLLDYTCGVVPITTVQPYENHYNIDDKYSAKDFAVGVLEESMKDAVGLPVSVQIITRPLRVESCLRVMKLIQSDINYNSPPNLS